jgi:hypothetical protein
MGSRNSIPENRFPFSVQDDGYYNDLESFFSTRSTKQKSPPRVPPFLSFHPQQLANFLTLAHRRVFYKNVTT